MQYFSLNTNVKQLRIGRGVSKGIGKELGKYVVATMEIPWNIIKNDISGYTHEDLSIAIKHSLNCDKNKILNSIDRFNWNKCFKIKQ